MATDEREWTVRWNSRCCPRHYSIVGPEDGPMEGVTLVLKARVEAAEQRVRECDEALDQATTMANDLGSELASSEQRVRELERQLEVEGDVWTCMTCGVIGDRQSCGACGAESRPGRWVREAKLATAVEALRFYADPTHWSANSSEGVGGSPVPGFKDRGHHAQHALAEIKGVETYYGEEIARSLVSEIFREEESG